MTWFIVSAGLLVAAVLVHLLRPLLAAGAPASEGARSREINLAILREQRADLERQRADGSLDPATYQWERDDLEKRALEDAVDAASGAAADRRRPRLAFALGAALPVMAVAAYIALGSPQALPGGPAREAAGNGSHALSQQQIAAMVERLAEKLQATPDDGQGWLMLARSYSVLGRFPESVAAYGRAAALLPPDAQMLADFADTVAMAQGRRLQGDPEKLVRRALDIDPRNPKALALSGTIYFDRQDYRSAIAEWQKALAVVPPESQAAAGIQGSIRDAENRLASAAGGGDGIIHKNNMVN